MAALCIILNAADKATVEGGGDKGYLNNGMLCPVPRQGGTAGNPNPCFVLNTLVLSDPSFAAAVPYLSTLPQKWSNAVDFPPEMLEN